MGKPDRVSAFLLERGRLGEIRRGEGRRLERALDGDPALAASLADLDRADKEFRERFPKEGFLEGIKAKADQEGGSPLETSPSAPLRVPPASSPPLAVFRHPPQRGFHPRNAPAGAADWLRQRPSMPPGPPLIMAACAAALVLAVVLPWTVFRGGRPEGVADRIKGGAGGPAELSLYLKGAADRLPDEAAVRAGDTVQVAYQAPEGRYGVIFSIDGRSAVTLHYPYGPGGETRLVSGRTVPLDEAYTLDDAPDYEIFFFVVGDRPLDPRNIFEAARGLAPKLAGNPRGALKQGTAFFKDYELKVLTLRKE